MYWRYIGLCVSDYLKVTDLVKLIFCDTVVAFQAVKVGLGDAYRSFVQAADCQTPFKTRAGGHSRGDGEGS